MTNGISEDQLSSYWVFSVLVQAHRLLSISYMWPGPVSFCYAFPSLLHSSLPPSQYSALLKHVCLCAVPTPTHAFMPNLFSLSLVAISFRKPFLQHLLQLLLPDPTDSAFLQMMGSVKPAVIPLLPVTFAALFSSGAFPVLLCGNRYCLPNSWCSRNIFE